MWNDFDDYNMDRADDEGVVWYDEDGNEVTYNTPNWWEL